MVRLSLCSVTCLISEDADKETSLSDTEIDAPRRPDKLKQWVFTSCGKSLTSPDERVMVVTPVTEILRRTSPNQAANGHGAGVGSRPRKRQRKVEKVQKQMQRMPMLSMTSAGIANCHYAAQLHSKMEK